MHLIQRIAFAAGRLATLSLALLILPLVCAIPAQAWTFKPLHAFTISCDGLSPENLLRDGTTGDLYGTTYADVSCTGGPYDLVFKLAPDESYTVLHKLTFRKHGIFASSLISDAAGSFYGIAANPGIVFKLSKDGSYTVLHQIKRADGTLPHGLVRDAATGDLYWTDRFVGQDGRGGVFKLAADGTYKMIHQFSGGEGGWPIGSLLLDAAGNLYGANEQGGDSGCKCGTIFKIAPDGSATVLHTFAKRALGYPSSGLVRDRFGNLYGTVRGGSRSELGAVYKLTPDGQFEVFHQFDYSPNGANPLGELLLTHAGAIYGTTSGNDGSSQVLYRIRPNGLYEVLYHFNTLEAGYWPTGGLIQDKDGNLFGTTREGGPGSWGVVYELMK